MGILGNLYLVIIKITALISNGDTHRDLWHPEEAIGCVANDFSLHGWKTAGDIASCSYNRPFL